jgi:PAS domain-containing protein
MMSWITSLLSFLTGRRTPAFRLAEALAGVPEAVALFDKHDRLVYCNRAFRQTYHIPRNARTRGRRFPAILYTSRLFEIAEEPLRDPRGDEVCDRILAYHCRIEFRALRTPEGGTLTTRIEIAGGGQQYDERLVDFRSAYLARKM